MIVQVAVYDPDTDSSTICCATVVIEQPVSSVMDMHDKFEYIYQLAARQRIKLTKLHTWMGLFGADSPKGTTLWCTDSWAQDSRMM